jgi:hypothetical protein
MHEDEARTIRENAVPVGYVLLDDPKPFQKTAEEVTERA